MRNTTSRLPGTRHSSVWRTALFLVAAGVASAAAPALAQYEEDEKLKDYAEQDRRYLERQQEAEEADRGRTPEEEEAAMFALAEELIRDRNYNAATSEHFRVQTDDPRLDPEAVTDLLESFRVFFDAFWQDRVELKPYDRLGRVFLFYSFHKYNQLLAGDWRFSLQRPKGHYGSMYDALTIHTDADGPGDLPDTLIHETTHQLVDQRMNVTAGGTLPWLSEGLATYFGNMYRDKSGTFVPAEVGTKSIGVFRGGKVYGSRIPGLSLRAFRRAIKELDHESLYGSLLYMRDPNQYYGGGALLHYNASWLLVHYLFHGEEGHHADAFARYLRLEGQDEGGPDVLLKEIGMTPQALDAAVAAHAGTIKIR